MNPQQLFAEDELEIDNDSFDLYKEDYAQQLLDDDAIDYQEEAFLKGYRDAFSW